MVVRSTPALGSLAPLRPNGGAAGKQPIRRSTSGLTGSRSCPVVRSSSMSSSSSRLKDERKDALHPKDSRRPSMHHSALSKPKVQSDGSVKACAMSVTIAAPAAEPPAEEPVLVNTWQERLQARLHRESDDLTTRMQVGASVVRILVARHGCRWCASAVRLGGAPWRCVLAVLAVLVGGGSCRQ